ncbi:MAG TPA: Rieske 2Fe-2S domain-containing protein [Pirellulaceae bacterium]|nr:Rieske 2Fe-2S domain-containing protein [Pirellulaceae bacterium]
MTTPSSTPAPLDLLPGRRTFFGWLTYLTGALATIVLGWPLVRYFIGTTPRAIHWVTLGELAEFPLDQTRMFTFDSPIQKPWDGHTAHTGVFVRNEGVDDEQRPRFLILAVNCAHLGCPVSWFPQSGLFMCPCHGGVYYANGERASGPPPRGLFRCVWRVQNGKLEVQAPHYPTLQDTLDAPPEAVAAKLSNGSCHHA